MLALALERRHAVLKLAFAGPFTVDDLEAIDPALMRFLGGGRQPPDGVRCLYDMTAVTALAVPPACFAARAKMPPLLPFGRVVVPFAGAPADFGRSYREMQGVTAHGQPVILPTLAAAYAHLGLSDAPSFEPMP